jgi:hypothetical protein
MGDSMLAEPPVPFLHPVHGMDVFSRHRPNRLSEEKHVTFCPLAPVIYERRDFAEAKDKIHATRFQ